MLDENVINMYDCHVALNNVYLVGPHVYVYDREYVYTKSLWQLSSF